MTEILMIITIVILIIAIAVMAEVNKKLKKMLEKSSEIKKGIVRTHPQVSRVNFDNVLSGREDVYKKYKNRDGLYEPVKTKNGIEIKPRKEE